MKTKEMASHTYFFEMYFQPDYSTRPLPFLCMCVCSSLSVYEYCKGFNFCQNLTSQLCIANALEQNKKDLAHKEASLN